MAMREYVNCTASVQKERRYSHDLRAPTGILASIHRIMDSRLNAPQPKLPLEWNFLKRMLDHEIPKLAFQLPCHRERIRKNLDSGYLVPRDLGWTFLQSPVIKHLFSPNGRTPRVAI